MPVRALLNDGRHDSPPSTYDDILGDGEMGSSCRSTSPNAYLHIYLSTPVAGAQCRCTCSRHPLRPYLATGAL